MVLLVVMWKHLSLIEEGPKMVCLSAGRLIVDDLKQQLMQEKDSSSLVVVILMTHSTPVCSFIHSLLNEAITPRSPAWCRPRHRPRRKETGNDVNI